MKRLNIENYFDYAATTPLLPTIFTRMQPYFTNLFGNPSSAHRFGQQAYGAVEDARNILLDHFHITNPDNLIFTGSSTEACNTILWATVFQYWKIYGKPGRLLISPLEHSAVNETARFLQDAGFCIIDQLPVNQYGQVDPDDVRKMIRSDTVLVSVIYGNNEIGTINPIPEIARVCKEKGIPFHTDATQYVAHNQIDFGNSEISMMNIAAHKCYGPKGTGAILLGNGVENFLPFIHGGKQENGKRAGTHNVPYIVGMAAAYQILDNEFNKRIAFERQKRDLLIQLISENIPDCLLTGHPTERLTNHASFAFKGIDSLVLQSLLDQKGFAVSIGSACRSSKIHGQQQLIDIGLSSEWANGGLRITVGIYTTDDAIYSLVNALKRSIRILRRS